MENKIYERLLERLRSLKVAAVGFRHVTLDLLGYRLGSMNPSGIGGEPNLEPIGDQDGDPENGQPRPGAKVKAP